MASVKCRICQAECTLGQIGNHYRKTHPGRSVDGGIGVPNYKFFSCCNNYYAKSHSCRNGISSKQSKVSLSQASVDVEEIELEDARARLDRMGVGEDGERVNRSCEEEGVGIREGDDVQMSVSVVRARPDVEERVGMRAGPPEGLMREVVEDRADAEVVGVQARAEFLRAVVHNAQIMAAMDDDSQIMQKRIDQRRAVWEFVPYGTRDVVVIILKPILEAYNAASMSGNFAEVDKHGCRLLRAMGDLLNKEKKRENYRLSVRAVVRENAYECEPQLFPMRDHMQDERKEGGREEEKEREEQKDREEQKEEQQHVRVGRVDLS
jgi:hypothetical protein